VLIKLILSALMFPLTFRLPVCILVSLVKLVFRFTVTIPVPDAGETLILLPGNDTMLNVASSSSSDKPKSQNKKITITSTKLKSKSVKVNH